MDSTTQNQTNEIYTETIGENNLSKNLKIYLLNPLSMGLVGFAAFFWIDNIHKFIQLYIWIVRYLFT
ncbi:MAG: hypothetical protein IPK06_12440 [Ignavibacteriae bacterium]|nr:hypothetical protein [Ignavibacteriota bacterium]